MYKNILIPTDGSELSRTAIEEGVSLAKATGARVTGIHVIPEFHTFTYVPDMLEDTREGYMTHAKVLATRHLDVLRNCAAAASVDCEAEFVVGDHPYKAIIEAAGRKHCDLVLMASHGRSGMSGLLLGSETQKVLAYSKVPVLVVR